MPPRVIVIKAWRGQDFEQSRVKGYAALSHVHCPCWDKVSHIFSVLMPKASENQLNTAPVSSKATMSALCVVFIFLFDWVVHVFILACLGVFFYTWEIFGVFIGCDSLAKACRPWFADLCSVCLLPWPRTFHLSRPLW